MINNRMSNSNNEGSSVSPSLFQIACSFLGRACENMMATVGIKKSLHSKHEIALFWSTLHDRSVIPVTKITGPELKQLILAGSCSNDVHYHVEGDLDLNDCTSLTALPKHLSVKGDLDLKNCTSLTTMPENLSVEGSLYMVNCTSLVHLAKNLVVGHSIDLNDCTSLTTMPENLSVKGKLCMMYCTSLMTLPAGLSVGEDFYLRGCIGLIALPENLFVGGDFSLSGCINLTALPEKVLLGGWRLMLHGCENLTTLPSWVTELGSASNGSDREVTLWGTGLSGELLTSLDVPGMRFIIEKDAPAKKRFSNLKKAIAFWDNLAPSEEKIAELSLLQHETRDLNDFLGRLTETVEYQNEVSCI